MRIILFVMLTAMASFSQDITDVSDQILQNNLMKAVRYLCSDEFVGRLPGHSGYNKAAEYSASEFEKVGLKKINGSYFQKLQVEYNEIYSPVKFNLINDGNIEKEYKLGKDFVCRGFTGSGNITGEIIFCGYGIDKEFYNDFKGVDVKNKIIMIFKPNPSWRIDDTDWGSGYPRAKSNIAAKNGASGIIFVSLPNAKEIQKPVASVLHGDGIQELYIPQIHVELNVAEELLAKSGYTLGKLQSIIDSEKKPFSIPLRTEAEILINAKYNGNAETMNVWGLLEGSDAVLKNEYLIIGAHLDHVGKQGDVIFPGANDNASGSAAVLEIAKIFKKNKITPKRSVIFALFASEEQGLNGAEFMANNLPVDENKITAMLNLDCIAYGDSIQVGNGKSAPHLWSLAKSINDSGIKFMVDETWQGGGADAGPFHNKGIPALYFASIYSYENIHTIYDTPESLNPGILEKITRLAFLTAAKVVNGSYVREGIIK